jgi:hypothetical protein
MIVDSTSRCTAIRKAVFCFFCRCIVTAIDSIGAGLRWWQREIKTERPASISYRSVDNSKENLNVSKFFISLLQDSFMRMHGLLLRKVKRCTVLRNDAPVWNHRGCVRGVATKMDDISFRIKNCDMYLFICSLFEHYFSNSDNVTSKIKRVKKKR